MTNPSTTHPFDGAVPLLHDFLSHAAARLPDKVAVVCKRDGKQERITYGALEAASNSLAHALIKRGVARGDP